MNTSQSISKIAPAFLKAQKEMSNAVKGANNPFFKSKYADLNAVREAVIPALNAQGISVLQPTCVIDGKNYVETILIHESGEFMSGFTEIISDKPNDAQKHGSGLSYGRRYGLSAITGIGAEDDDANHASGKKEVQPFNSLEAAIERIRNCETLTDLADEWASSKKYQGNEQFQREKNAQKEKLTKK